MSVQVQGEKGRKIKVTRHGTSPGRPDFVRLDFNGPTNAWRYGVSLSVTEALKLNAAVAAECAAALKAAVLRRVA